MTCQYNDPSVFDPNAKKTFIKLKRARRELFDLKTKFLHKSKWKKTNHPHDMALDIQILEREIKVLFNAITPKLVTR